MNLNSPLTDLYFFSMSMNGNFSLVIDGMQFMIFKHGKLYYTKPFKDFFAMDENQSKNISFIKISKAYKNPLQSKLNPNLFHIFLSGFCKMNTKIEDFNTDIDHSLQKNADKMQKDWIYADTLNNLIVNYEAGAGKVGIAVANYFTSKGADAHISPQSGDEFWLVVFNPKIIKKVTVVDPKTVTSNFPFILPHPLL